MKTFGRRPMLAALAGAAALSHLTRDAHAATSLSYWHHFASQSEIAGLNAILALFARAHPDIAVSPETIPNGEFMPKISSAVLAGGRPDTAMVISERFADLAAMDALIDLSDRVKTWKLRDNFPPNRWAGLSTEGAIYAVPGFSIVDWMYYRTDYFEQAGLAGPPKTLDEFVIACRKLTDPSKGRYGFGLRGGSGCFKYVLDMMEAFGSPIVKNGKPAIDRAAAIEAVGFYAGLFVKDKVAPPSAPSDSYRQIMEAFRTGQTAMVWHHTGSLIEISQALKPGAQFSTAPMPAGPAAHVARLSFAGNGILKKDHLDAAWAWISFWGETDAAIAMLEATGYFPASTAALADKRISDNPLYAAAVATLEFGRLPNNFVGVAGWSENVVQPAFQSVLIGRSTAAQAVDTMIRGLDSAMR